MAAAAAAARRALPTPSTTMLFVCDVQERFRPLVWRFPAVVKSARALAAGARALGVPLLTTEQNPARLGGTVAELAPLLAGGTLVAKTRFSMLVPEAEAALAAAAPAHVVLCGIEAHVCVAQTAAALLARDIVVHVVVDGISSQRAGDRAVALSALAAAGARLTTTEAILFALLGDAAHPAFKDVQKIVMAHAREVAETPDDRLDTLV